MTRGDFRRSLRHVRGCGWLRGVYCRRRTSVGTVALIQLRCSPSARRRQPRGASLGTEAWFLMILKALSSKVRGAVVGCGSVGASTKPRSMILMLTPLPGGRELRLECSIHSQKMDGAIFGGEGRGRNALVHIACSGWCVMRSMISMLPRLEDKLECALVTLFLPWPSVQFLASRW